MLDGTLPRRAIHRAFEDVRPYVAGAESGETIEGFKERVRVGRDLKEVIEAFSSIDTVHSPAPSCDKRCTASIEQAQRKSAFRSPYRPLR